MTKEDYRIEVRWHVKDVNIKGSEGLFTELSETKWHKWDEAQKKPQTQPGFQKAGGIFRMHRALNKQCVTSLTSVPSKIMKKIVLESTEKHLEKSNHQTQPARLYEGKVLLLKPDFCMTGWPTPPQADLGKPVDEILLDFPKAFDRLSQDPSEQNSQPTAG